MRWIKLKANQMNVSKQVDIEGSMSSAKRSNGGGSAKIYALMHPAGLL
jgi:hypothetical protein